MSSGSQGGIKFIRPVKGLIGLDYGVGSGYFDGGPVLEADVLYRQSDVDRSGHLGIGRWRQRADNFHIPWLPRRNTIHASVYLTMYQPETRLGLHGLCLRATS